MSNNKLNLIIADLDKEIDLLEAKRAKAQSAQLLSFDFSDKLYYSNIQIKHESSIALLNKAKEIVKKHLEKK